MGGENIPHKQARTDMVVPRWYFSSLELARLPHHPLPRLRPLPPLLPFEKELELNQIFLRLNILTILLWLEFKVFLTTLILLRPNKSIRKTLVLVLTMLLLRSNFK